MNTNCFKCGEKLITSSATEKICQKCKNESKEGTCDCCDKETHITREGEKMKVEYSLSILKEELDCSKREKSILEKVDPIVSARQITKLKHEIADLEFAIEVLETYQD